MIFENEKFLSCSKIFCDKNTPFNCEKLSRIYSKSQNENFRNTQKLYLQYENHYFLLLILKMTTKQTHIEHNSLKISKRCKIIQQWKILLRYT